MSDLPMNEVTARLRTDTLIGLVATAGLHFLAGDWFNLDTHEFAALGPSNGFFVPDARDYADRLVEVFVVTTGKYKGVWQATGQVSTS